MEGNTEGFFLEHLTYLQTLLLVVPDTHTLVDAACHHLLLLYAHIHSIDGS